MPLASLAAYSQFIAEVVNRPTVERSTIRVWSVSPYTGVAEGEVYFANQLWLRMREELDFDDSLITSYGYEVVNIQNKDERQAIAHGARFRPCGSDAERQGDG